MFVCLYVCVYILSTTTKKETNTIEIFYSTTQKKKKNHLKTNKKFWRKKKRKGNDLRNKQIYNKIMSWDDLVFFEINSVKITKKRNLFISLQMRVIIKKQNRKKKWEKPGIQKKLNILFLLIIEF